MIPEDERRIPVDSTAQSRVDLRLMASHPSFLGLAVETRKRIYAYVFFRPCEVDRMGNSPGTLKTVKDWLHDVDTAVLGVSKQVHAEAVSVAFDCNTFTWPAKPVTQYRPFLLSLVHRIKRIFITHYALSQIRYHLKSGNELELIQQHFPERLTHVIVNAYSYRFTDMADMILEDVVRMGKWVALLLDLQRLKPIRIRFLQHGQLHDELDIALDGKFPRCIMSKLEAGPEFDYRSQPGFEEDYSDEFDNFSSDSEECSALDLEGYLSSVLGDFDKKALKNLLEHGHPAFDMEGHLLLLAEYDKATLRLLLKADDSGWETCSEGDIGTDSEGTDDAGKDATEPDEADPDSAEIDHGDTDDAGSDGAETDDGA